MDSVRAQYERYPYPPVSAFALPRRGQAVAVAFETGTKLCFGEPRSGRGIRILVAGGGTLEPLVVAESNPFAACVVAVDLSQEALRILGRRERLAQALRLLRGGHAPLEIVSADLFAWEPIEPFDLIFASNILQHVAHPGALLSRLSSWLKPNGVIRIATYPKHSRLWMRETGRWLRANGITRESKNIRARAFDAVSKLPDGHPVASCFMSHQEVGSDAGVVDAFLHACENPLGPLEWKREVVRAGLELRAETQTETSRSTFLDDVVPSARGLDAWTKLEVLDQVLELCANPTLWLARVPTTNLPTANSSGSVAVDRHEDLASANRITMPSRVRYELRQGLERASALCGMPANALVDHFAREVGSRVSPNDGSRVLPGLAIADYAAAELLEARAPYESDAWSAFDPHARLCYQGDPAIGATIQDQVDWLQARYGALMNEIEVHVVRTR